MTHNTATPAGRIAAQLEQLAADLRATAVVPDDIHLHVKDGQLQLLLELVGINLRDKLQEMNNSRQVLTDRSVYRDLVRDVERLRALRDKMIAVQGARKNARKEEMTQTLKETAA